MALIVEDGSGLANAESYTSVAEADAYFEARGNEAWGDVDNKEAALRKATDYMAQAYNGRWRGYRLLSTQALDWPRANVQIDDAPYYSYVPSDSVPTLVKNACAELALKSASADLAPDLERAKAKVQVGSIVVEYDPLSPESKRFRAVDMMLRPLLLSYSNTLELVRS